MTNYYKVLKVTDKWAKYVLPFYLFVFLPLTMKAQVGDYRNDFAIGGSAGYMLSNVAFVPDVPQGMQQGLTAGFTMRYSCEKYFKSICAIVAEVNIVQTGWKENILDVDNQPVYYADDVNRSMPLSYQRKMTYLQIPFLARLGWGRERKGFQGFFQAGPQVGIFLDESTSTNLVADKALANERASKVVAQNSLAVENKFDYGIAAGAGVEFSMRHVGHFMLEGRYYYGLGNIFKNSKSDYFGKSNFGQIVVKASYLFDIVRTKNDKIK